MASFTFLKRFCLAVMRDQSLAMLAIVVSGLEEALDRCTLAARDRALRKWLGLKEPTEAEKVAQRRHWACHIFCTSRELHLLYVAAHFGIQTKQLAIACSIGYTSRFHVL